MTEPLNNRGAHMKRTRNEYVYEDEEGNEVMRLHIDHSDAHDPTPIGLQFGSRVNWISLEDSALIRTALFEAETEVSA